MDKQNYTLSETKRQEIKQKFRKIRHSILKKLKEKDVIKRKRIIKNYEVLLQAMFLYVVENLSFQRLSDIMACEYGISMSDTAWKKQILKSTPAFFDAVTEYLSKETPVLQKNPKKIYALDATNIATEGRSGTVMRVHTQLSLTDRISSSVCITDQYTAESVKNFNIEESCIYLADRAYGKASQLAYILDHNADFIFRISPSLIKLYKDPLCKERFDATQILKGSSFSHICYFKYNKKTYCVRLVGSLIPPEKQLAAKKRACRKASKNQRKIQPQTVLYSSWIILATSLSESTSASEILETYRLRWHIELLFKREKTLLRFHKIRSSSSKYIFAVSTLWLSVALLLSVCQFFLLSIFGFDFSLFNSFSLAKLLFA